MATPRFDIEKFNGENDFSLWKIKIKAILTNLGVVDALSRDTLEAMTDRIKGKEKTRRRWPKPFMQKGEMAGRMGSTKASLYMMRRCLGDVFYVTKRGISRENVRKERSGRRKKAKVQGKHPVPWEWLKKGILLQKYCKVQGLGRHVAGLGDNQEEHMKKDKGTLRQHGM